MDNEQKLTGWRRVMTYAGSWTVAIAYIALWLRADADFHVLPALYVLLFLAAPVVNELPSIAARLAARAFWWQSTLLYTLLGGYGFYRLTGNLSDHDIVSTLAKVEFHWEMLAVFSIGVGSLVALAAAGARGLISNLGQMA